MAETAPRHGKAWSPPEDARLVAGFHAGASVSALAQRHARGDGAIRARLQRLGLVEPDPAASPDGGDGEPPARATAGAPTAALSDGIDRLIEALNRLKAPSHRAAPPRRAVAAVALAYDRLDAMLLETVVPAAPRDADLPADDPLPDRLRDAFGGIVAACVPDVQDRHIARTLLGLDGDGERLTLQQVGDDLGVSRERIRQRRNRAFRNIAAALPRRIASAARLRAVLADVSRDADWTQPDQAARTVVRLVNDRLAAAQQLTVMLMLAAGASGDTARLRHSAEAAARDACRDPTVFGRWQLDRWSDATAKAVLNGRFERFGTLPDDMATARRSTGEGGGRHALTFQSRKLRRMVECESGMEFSVYQWLEASDDVQAYQEQPIAIDYSDGGRARRYYPDAVVLGTDGRLIVVEVKPVFTMFRQRTLAKALAAIAYLQPRGIGYLMIDSRGRTLRDLAMRPYDAAQAQAVELDMQDGAIPFKRIKDIMADTAGGFDPAAFMSMAINRDWRVTDGPVHISRLAPELSFRPMLAAATSHDLPGRPG